jgi:hypothetical protein
MTSIAHTPRRVARTLSLFAVLAVAALALAAAAGAAPPVDPDDPPDPPPAPAPKPNLVISAGSVAPVGTDQWEVRYTVSNRGNAEARLFYVDTKQDGSALLKSTLHYPLAPGASRSEVMTFPRTANCYLAVRFQADSRGTVHESSETDNSRWAVGHTGPTCATLPKYKVKAVSFQAVDETGIDLAGSDEPYWIFSGVGIDGTQRTSTSHVYENIDTGDTAPFGVADGCLYINCAGGAAPNGMGFSIQAWEQDGGDQAQNLATTATAFTTVGGILTPLGAPAWIGTTLTTVGTALNVIAGWLKDDLIGSQTYAYDLLSLASRLPSVGSSFSDVRSFTDSGHYKLTVQVTRVA